MEFLHVRIGEVMIFIAIIITRFGTHAHSYIDVQLLHPAPMERFVFFPYGKVCLE